MDLSVDLSFSMYIYRDSTGYKRGLGDIGIYSYIYIHLYPGILPQQWRTKWKEHGK